MPRSVNRRMGRSLQSPVGGQRTPPKKPGFGQRYKVRIFGKQRSEKVVPDEQLPMAEVLYPVTAGSGLGGARQTANIKQGDYVVGFYRDGMDQTEPVIWGLFGTGAQTDLFQGDPTTGFVMRTGYKGKMDGSLQEKDARISLAKFLRANIGITTELISGIKLAPYQEIMIKGMMNRNFSMLVLGRGLSKSFSASLFCFLQCIFEPGTKILIAGPTFRTARNIFNNIEKFSEAKGAELLFQCFGAKSRRGDEFSWDINGGSIKAIPLNGEKIRGFRANVLVLDEFLLLPEDIIKNVLMPFLVAPQNIKERMQIREEEDKLIARGVITEEDRMIFPNNSKMIALSSASYTFENLYKTYEDWTKKITSDTVLDSKYFVAQMSYEAAPQDMIDKNIIEEAQNGGASNSSFLREYCAQFTDGSDSYFSFRKMEECTLKDEKPHTLIRGSSGKKYILAIDPNFNDSPSADYFAMAVMEFGNLS